MSDSIIEKAPQTSEAQSGDTLKIAAVAKTKDPRRVTAGRRMVEINWREKEREISSTLEKTVGGTQANLGLAPFTHHAQKWRNTNTYL